MASITTRETGTTGTDGVTRKNLPLTNAEIDQNFINLNNTVGTTNVTTLGTVTTGTWSATTIAVNRGGTGQTSYTNGQLLIGNTTGNTLTKTTLTAGTGISITNGSGSITIATGQDISTSANVQFNSIGVGTAASATAGEIRATNAITAFYSDERLKTDIELIQNALEKVLSLRGVTYRGNNIAESFGYSTTEKYVGVLAGDLEKVLPEAVKPAPFDIMLFENTEISKSGENYKTVQYEKLVPLLIEAIKELNKEVQKLKEN
jgi:hypothetical protein